MTVPFRRRRRLSSGGAFFALALVLGVLAAPALAASADEENSGIGLSVTTTATPGATAKPAPVSGSPSGSGSGSAPVVTTPVTTQPTIDRAAADTFDLGGVLYISGVRTSSTPSVNPLRGGLDVSFTVLNVSSSTIDAGSDFALSGPFGIPIGASEHVDVAGLKPGESRVVSATIDGVGQWTFVSSAVRFVPPATVDGVELSPVARDAFSIVLPWFVLALLVLASAAVVTIVLVRRTRAAGSGAAALVPEAA